MAIGGLVSHFILAETLLFYSFSIFAFTRAYRKTQSTAHLRFLAYLINSLLAHILIYIAGFLKPEIHKESTIITLVALTNSILGISFIFLMNSIMFIREDKLPIFSHVATFLMGMILAIFSIPDHISVEYNADANFWIISYNSTLLQVASLCVMVIYVSYFLLYLWRKMHQFINRKKFDLSFVAFFFLILWMATFNVEATKIPRFFVFPAIIFLFGLTTYLEPLNLLASNKLPEELIIITKHGNPILRYNIHQNNTIANLDEIRLLIAGNKVISESIKAESSIDFLNIYGRKVRTLQFEQCDVILIGNEIDRNSYAATTLSYHEFIENKDLSYLDSSLTLNNQDQKDAIETIRRNFRVIDATKKSMKKN